MSTIPASSIVNVTPSVQSAGGTGLNLVGMFLTNGTRVPIGTVVSFVTLAAVQAYFGAGSVEAAKAAVYFGGYDNSPIKPASLSFAQYNPNAVAAFLRGGNLSATTLAQLQALSGTIIIAVDGITRTSASINLSGASSFSVAATTIQTALNQSGANPTLVNFTGVIASGVLTASAVTGTLAPGQQVSGSGISAGVWITSQLTGTPGGAGTYQLSSSITIGSEAMTTQGVNVVVTFDSVSSAFVITSGITGALSTIAFPTGTLSPLIFLTSVTGAVLSQGAAAAVPAIFMAALTVLTQNWATFLTTFDPDNGSGNTVKLAFAAWVNTTNNRYTYVCRDLDSSPTTTVPATNSLGQLIKTAGYSGTCLIYDPLDNNIAAFVCGAAASIDFTQVNGRITFAFKHQSGLLPTVTDQVTASNLIANGYNFYGAYGTANDEFVWLYDGHVSGPFTWMDGYIDQIWLNNAFQLALMILLRDALSIPYNASGRGLIQAALQDSIDAGLFFGAFSGGVTLSSAQKAEVDAAAGLPISRTLETRGWYLQVLDASPAVRAVRGSPPCNFWYTDAGSVQHIELASIALQ